MAAKWTLTGDIAGLTGGASVVEDLTGYVITSEGAKGAILDTDADQVLLGTWPITFAADGTFSVSGLPASDDAAYAPSGHMFKVVVSWYDPTGRRGHGMSIWQSAFFDVTADLDLSDVPLTSLPVQISQETYERLLAVLEAGEDIPAAVDAALATAVPPVVEAAVDDELAARDILVGSDARALQWLPTESGWLFALTDDQRKLLLGAMADGTIVISKVSLPVESVDDAQLTADLAARQMLPTTVESGVKWAVTSETGQMYIWVDVYGVTHIARSDFTATSDRPAVGETHIAQPFTGINGRGQVKVTRLSDGQVTATTDAAWSTIEPAWAPDGRLTVLANPSGGAVLPYVMDVDGGNLTPLAPTSTWDWFGDSMTENGSVSLLDRLASALPGVAAINKRGIGSQATPQIGARYGATPIAVNVAGNSVPTSGAVNATFTPPILNGAGAGTRSVTGWLVTDDGTEVHGTASQPGTGTQATFTRTTSGTAKAIADGSTFRIEHDPVNALTIWTGRNDNLADAGVRAASVATVLAMIDHYKPLVHQIVVIGVVYKDTEIIGSGGRADVDAYNSALSAAVDGRAAYIDPNPYLTGDALDDAVAAGYVTATAQDATDRANGIVPTSLRSDGTHINTYAYQVWVDNELVPYFQTKEWFPDA